MSTLHVPSVYVIMRNPENHVLFIPREHTGFMDGKLTLPAGHVEHLESNKKAIIREAKEETSVTLFAGSLRHVFTMQRLCRNRQGEIEVRDDVYFETTEWTGTPKNTEPHKHGEPLWLPVADLPYDEIMDYQAIALRGMRNGQTYAELGWKE